MKKSLHIVLYSDGGARGNPGPAAYGIVLYKKEKNEKLIKFFDEGKFLDTKTNNQAEYLGVIAGLERAKRLGGNTIEIFLDSELIVEQLNMRYRVKDKELAKLFLQTWNLLRGFTKYSITHIPREKNKEADRLVNMALDAAIRE